MSKLKKLTTYILIAVLTVTMLEVPIISGNKTTVQAATKKEKALKSYVKVLKKTSKFASGMDSCTFALIDLNGDKIPEFLCSQDDGYHLAIYAYVNGKAKWVGEGFSGGRTYYPNLHIYYTWTYHDAAHDKDYYRFNGKKMVSVCSKHGSDEFNVLTGKRKSTEEILTAKDVYAPYLYKVNGKKTTKAKYEEMVRQIKKKGKKAKIIKHKATKKNIRKYLDKNYKKDNSSSKKLNKVIKHCRDVYYGVNKSLKKYKKYSSKGNYTEYWNGNRIVKAITYAGNFEDDVHIKGYTSEFYFDSKGGGLVFAFAYKKTSKGVKEFRAYYEGNKLYRYIDSNGKTVDYKKGKDISNVDNMAGTLYEKSVLYFEHAVV